MRSETGLLNTSLKDCSRLCSADTWATMCGRYAASDGCSDDAIVDIEDEEYESHRANNQSQKHKMHMSKSHCKYLLMREAGLSRSDIKKAMNKVRRCVRQRAKMARRSVKLQPMEATFKRAKKKDVVAQKKVRVLRVFVKKIIEHTRTAPVTRWTRCSTTHR